MYPIHITGYPQSLKQFCISQSKRGLRVMGGNVSVNVWQLLCPRGRHQLSREVRSREVSRWHIARL